MNKGKIEQIKIWLHQIESLCDRINDYINDEIQKEEEE